MHFFPGANVVYGPSDTGKSFVVDAIDFMLGGKGPLRDIPERVGYNRALLGLSTSGGGEFTIARSTEGGPFVLFEGLLLAIPEDIPGKELSEQHSDKNDDNLSTFLLSKLGLAKMRLKKNKRGDQQSLSFRNLARLVVVNEEEIIQKRSPLSDGNYVADTANTSTFKLLLTGVDDAALGTPNPTTSEQHSREGQADLLAELIRDHKAQIRASGAKPEELPDQLERLQESMSREGAQLAFSEKEFRKLTDRRRELLSKIESGTERAAEIRALLSRFALLNTHYQSDVERLRGMTEAGSLFAALGTKQCPLCGAAPEHQNGDPCDGDIDAVVSAAQVEMEKTEARRSHLLGTINELQKEGKEFDRQLPRLDEKLRAISALIDQQLVPVKKARAWYKELAEKSAKVQGTLSLVGNMKDLEGRLAKLHADDEASSVSGNAADVELSTSIVDKFAKFVHGALTAWTLPNADRIHFDLKNKDLVINGKSRISHGKGLRAITQAAFTVGLLDYCLANDTPHPGFAIVDSPLLSYKEPDSADDDMRGTSVDAKFFEHLASLASDRQVIVIENRDPPQELAKREGVQKFTGVRGVGRFGFFPLPKPPEADDVATNNELTESNDESLQAESGD